MSGGKIKIQDIAKELLMDTSWSTDLVFVESVDGFYTYQENEGYFQHLSKVDMQREIIKILHAKNLNLTPSTLNDLIHLMKILAPARRRSLSSPFVAFKDATLNLDTFNTHKTKTRDQFATFYVPFSSSEMSKCSISRFLQFLDEVLVDEEGRPSVELQELVQQMFGFFLLPTLRPHTVFFLVGGGANGKSVLLKVLSALFSEHYTTYMTVEELTKNRFAASELIGKKINICNEEESRYFSMDRFKSLVSGDPIKVEQKYGQPFTLFPETKFIFATNNMPQPDSLNYGIIRRTKIISFRKTFTPDMQDYSLTEKLLQELPGIFLWAIQGAKLLVDNQFRFISGAESIKSQQEVENEISSAVSYIREKYDIDHDAFIANDDLYTDYRLWCDLNGRKPMNSKNFFKDLKTAFALFEKRKQIDGQRRCGRTLSLKIL